MTPPTTTDAPTPNIYGTAWLLAARAAEECGEYANVGEMLPPWRNWDVRRSWFLYDRVGQSCSERLAHEQNLLCVADKLAEIADAVGPIVWSPVKSTGTGCAEQPPPSYVYGEADASAVTACDIGTEWEIPPQADKDRFIVRDLAVHALGMLATLDAYADINPFGGAPLPCSKTFANVVSGAAVVQDSSQSVGLFGVPLVVPETHPPKSSFPVFPPSQVPLLNDASGDPKAAGNNNSPAIARSSLEVEAQILRSAGRLLHDLIRRSVYSDMAAATQRAAQAMDPDRGNQIAWGVSDEGPYGTLAHAARVLTGRWEIGEEATGTFSAAGFGDRRCEGIAAIDLLQSLGDDVSARIEDRSIRTPGEQTAVQFVERSGIVVPSCAIASATSAAAATGGASPLRSALVDQLLFQEQTQNHLVPNASAPQRAVFERIVGSLSDPELTFAFRRALRTYRLLTNSADPFEATGDASSCAPVAVPASSPGGGPAVVLPAGLKAVAPLPDGSSAVAPSVAAVKGIVVDGGLARSRLASDPIARAGALLEASQCGETFGSWSEWGTPIGSMPAQPEQPQADLISIPVAVFQDPFAIGQALERRLVVMQTASAGLDHAGKGPDSISRGAIAELKSWAGSAIVHAWPVQSGSAPMNLQVRIAGLANSDLGVAPGMPAVSAAQSAFGFVYGPPWVAECATHVRRDCPAGFDATYVQQASSVTEVTGSLAGSGTTGRAFQLTVSIAASDPSRKTNFTPPPPVADPATPSNAHLYMIRLHEPGDPLGHGRVLGTLPLHYSVTSAVGQPSMETYDLVSFVDAPMQRELLHDAIDLGRWIGERPPRLGDPSASQSSGYCVDGVPRNVFVPLDNELTSDSSSFEDSWKHYLDLAQQAAQRADDLGQNLIQQSLAIDQRKEAAGEQLADLCGDFGMLNHVGIAPDGTMTPMDDDPTVASCLNEAKTDVVFLGPVPDMTSEKSPTDFLKNRVLRCSDPTLPAAASDPLCKKDVLTFDTLKLTAPQGVSSGDSTVLGGACGRLSGITSSLSTGFQGTDFRAVVGDPSFVPSKLHELVGGLKMTVDLQDRWEVTYAEQVMISSTNTTFWPACLQQAGCANLNSGGGPPSDGFQVARFLNNAFRWCPAAPNADITAQPALGACGDGTAQAELNGIKWRVMQSLWMLAMSSGELPAGMFVLPVPVVTFGPTPASTMMPYASEYSGQLAPLPCKGSPCPWQLTTSSGSNGATSADAVALNTVFDTDPAFTIFPPSASSEVPRWYRTMYANNNLLKHAVVGNSDELFDQCLYRGGSHGVQIKSGEAWPTCPPELQPKPYELSFAQLLDENTSSLDGIACPTPWGEPSKGSVRPGPPGQHAVAKGDQPFWVEIANAKLGQNVVDGKGLTTGHVGGIPEFDRMGWDYPVDEADGNGNITSGYPGESESIDGLVAASDVPPWIRAPAFIGEASAPNGTCGATKLLLQAATLACAAQQGVIVAGIDPNHVPVVQSANDIVKLEAWIGVMHELVMRSVQGLYAESIPTRVIQDFPDRIGTGTKAGQHGAAVLDMEQALAALPGQWARLGNDIAEIANAVKAARLALTAAQLQRDSAVSSIALQEIQVQGQMTQATLGFISSITSAAAGAITSGGLSFANVAVGALAASAQVDTGNREMSVLTQQLSTAEQAQANQVAQALNALASNTGRTWADVQVVLGDIRGSVGKVVTAAQALQLIEGKAQYDAALGTGQDFVEIAGQEVPIPVNTVLRRQLSATQIRYDRALQDAKALAYMARRAIEQRIGVPLDAITARVGPLDAPASWGDDICSLTGVNYKQLSTAVPAGSDGGGIGGTVDQTAIASFADAWVGDYVQKLKDFVGYYNAQYPSHEGDDTAVMSLRYDLLPPVPECTQTAPNLLFNSGRLDHLVASDSSRAGWELLPCTSGTKCLTVMMGGVLAPPLDGPLGAVPAPDWGVMSSMASTGISWLSDVPQSTASADAGASSQATDAGMNGTSAAPGNVVSQAVQLDPGTYVLSWWDQARDLAGNVAWSSTSQVPYVVHVFDPSWLAVATFHDAPYSPAPVEAGVSASLWSARRTLSFTVTQTGVYHVTFGASTPGDGLGSVAIANVQLEGTATSNEPTVYAETYDTRLVTAFNCPRSDLRSAFVHNCDDAGRCSYDLTVPMLVDTDALNAGDSPLRGKLAQGNFNFRDMSLAVNLVGTGVHDCSGTPTPNCYGAGYVEYTLEHDATNAGILDYNGNSRVFDFGVASVEHGKALAAERYLTMPLSSADQSLLSQPGIQHTEFRGRPLDGAYRLRIWDSPALKWDRVEDIQIVFNYRYWSQIVANGATGN